jgi:hypothetical protein
MPNYMRQFREIVCVDFEFASRPGERPKPMCMVAWELRSGRKFRLFHEELVIRSTPPFATGQDVLFLAYFASADLGCYLGLTWPLPENVIDAFVEFRNLTNGLFLPCGAGLIGALTYFGLDSMSAVEKESMQQLAMRSGEHTREERENLLGYCERDVSALAQIFYRIEPHLDVERAVLRGEYMKVVAQMEHRGVPIDARALEQLRLYWSQIEGRLISRIDANFHVFEGRTFRLDKFASYLAEWDIPWPRLESGRLNLDDDTFRFMAARYRTLSSLRELRGALSKMRHGQLAIGADGRNRTLISPYSTITGRNAPSSSEFIFGPAVWLRGLIRPEPGYGLAYVDYAQQEFGIAAALSGDRAMMTAYDSSGDSDPYLEFAKQARAVPQDATVTSHWTQREQFKVCALGVLYSIGPKSLAERLGQPTARGRELIDLHQRTYPTLWRWLDAVLDHAMLKGELYTTFGWTIRSGPQSNSRSLKNFPMQANGAEMLRLACLLATDRGVIIVAPVHDALLIEAPIADLDAAVAATQAAMAEASAIVLDGFTLRSDAKLFRYPERYMDERGRRMWDAVWSVITEIENENQR